MKFLITGAKGQLAREFLKVLKNDEYEIKALDREGLDVSDSHAVSDAVSYHKPDVVINCAAYNFVDKAEEDFETAFRVNTLGPKTWHPLVRSMIHYLSTIAQIISLMEQRRIFTRNRISQIQLTFMARAN